MKFSQILRGKRAEKSVEVPGYLDAAGKPFVVLMTPLTGGEHETALVMARERAVAKGVAEPRIGEPIYDLALMASVLVLGCVDPDSPANARTPSFASIDEILGQPGKLGEGMHPEDVVYLHEHHEAWQDQISPSKERLGETDLMEKVREVAGADGQAAFMRLSPSTRLLFATFTARLASNSLEARSTPGSNFDDAGTKAAPSPPEDAPETAPTSHVETISEPEAPEAS